MPKYTWTIAGGIIVAILMVFVCLGTWREHQALQTAQAELTAAQQEASQLRDLTESNQQSLEEKLSELKERAARLQREKEEAAKSKSTLEQEMRAALQSKDVTISELQGKLEVNILDRVLFDSGQATLKPEGQTVLAGLAKVLEQYPNRQLHVVGHTDNVPIHGTLAQKYPTNWELSAARATAAVRFLVEQAGVDPRRLGAVGYGEFHPVADNSTEEGRAQNRRITIVILPELFAGVEPETKAPADSATEEAKPVSAPELKPDASNPMPAEGENKPEPATTPDKDKNAAKPPPTAKPVDAEQAPKPLPESE